jgi:hypothetical protein
MATQTSKIMHIINDSGIISIRRPYDPAVAATQKVPERYRSSEHFMDHERSAFLEHVLANERYIQITAHAFGQDELDDVSNWLSGFARRGLRARTGQNTEPETWKFLYGHYTDKGSLFMIPADSDIKSLDDMGIHIVDPIKAPKYFKRVVAPYQYSVFGSINSIVEDELGTIVEFELGNGYIGTHRNIELDKLPSDLHRSVCDGVMLLETEFLRNQVGVKDRNLSTYGCKPTTFDPTGVGKGFGHAVDGLEFDIVTYGAKKALVFEEFFFGILGGLKPGEKFRSDLQSMINFDEYLYALEGARILFAEITESLGDPDKIRGLLLSKLKAYQSNNLLVLSKEVDDKDVPTDQDISHSATERWMLIAALERGFGIEVEPGLFRRVCNYLLFEAMNCELGRIPFDHLGTRVDICPDPAMFDAYGEVHPENSIIPEGTCVMIDVPQGPIVAYRQPNGMAMEHSQSVNFHMRQFEKFAGRKRAFYGQDLPQIMEPMNGADLDDTLCVIHDPAAVKQIRSLSYPVTFKMVVADKPKHSAGRYYDQLTRKVAGVVGASYSAKDFIESIQQARQMSLKLGQVVNTIMLDTALSGKHKVNMMDYLADMIQAEPDKDRKIWILEKREWLADREDYQMRHIATNLEAIIDYCIQGKGDPKQFDDMVKQVTQMKAETQVFPMIFAKQGTGFMGQGRISPTKLLGKDYILAPSLLCAALNEVEAERNQFVQDLKEHEWNCITFVPEEVDMMFGSSPDNIKIAKDLRKWFIPKVIAAMSNPNRDEKRKSYNNVLYGQFHECKIGVCVSNCPNKNKLIEPGLLQHMLELDQESRMFVAVEMKRLVHHNAVQKIAEDGTVRGVPDGIFANNVMFGYYLDACDAAGITGKYITVEIDNVSATNKVKDKTFQVVVIDGVVLRKSDEFWIGTVSDDTLVDGEYKMVNGMLELRAPSPAIVKRQEFASNSWENPIKL